jgi:hypothetical protein
VVVVEEEAGPYVKERTTTIHQRSYYIHLIIP